MKLQRFLTLLLLLSAALGSVAFATVTPDDFHKPPSNLDPMNIYFYKFNYHGIIPDSGDIVGAFDYFIPAPGDTNELCVGTWQVDSSFAKYASLGDRHLIAYKEYKNNGAVVDSGFAENDPIHFYILLAKTNQVVSIPDSNLTFYRSDSTDAQGNLIPLAQPVPFSGRGTAIVEIHSGQSKLTINVDPDSAGATIPKADQYLYSIADSEMVTIRIDSSATKEHYEFSHWTVDGADSLTETVTLLMTTNHIVTAHYVLKNYTLTAVPQPAVGDVIPVSPTQFQALQWADIFAKPAEGSGYKFDHWTASPAGAQIEDSTQAGTRVLMTGDIQVTAMFTLESDTLTIAVVPPGVGSTTPEPGVFHIYQYSTTVNLSATPIVEGYKFKHWADQRTDTTVVLSTDSSYALLMDGNHDLQAVFEKKMVTLTLNVDQHLGSIYIKMQGDADSVLAESQYSLEYGTQFTLWAVSSDAGKYPFDAWSGDVATLDNPTSATIDSSMSITANFEDTTPVELSSFQVQYAPNSVNNALALNWQTASETNNLGFEVERSIATDDNWKKIAFLQGFGTTASAKFYEYIDDEATTKGVYYYRLKQIDTNGEFSYSEVVEFEVSAPNEFALKQNYPNPFNPSTRIVFQLKEDVDVNLAVYDLLGREVATVVSEPMKAGTHQITFDAGDLSAGVYFYSLKAGSFTEMKKMTLIK